jgi:hypothetical protein
MDFFPNGNVIIASEELQNLDLYSALTAFDLYLATPAVTHTYYDKRPQILVSFKGQPHLVATNENSLWE